MFVIFINSCSKSDTEDLNTSALDALTISHSMKSYELYSWPEGNQWKYSVLIGTNATKSLTEVKSNSKAISIVTGNDQLKQVLSKFPQGEYISLIGQGCLQKAWAGKEIGDLQLQPQPIIDKLNSQSVINQLNFSVLN
jgi:hypothetical protein